MFEGKKTLSAKLSQLEQQHTHLEAQHQTSTKHNLDLQSRLQTTANKNSDLQASLERSQNAKTIIQNENINLKYELGTQTTELGRVDKQLAELEEINQQMNQQNDVLNQQNDALNQQNEHLQEESDDQARKVSQLHQNTQAQEQTITSLKAEIERLRSQNHDLETKVAEMSEEVQMISSQNDNLGDELRELRERTEYPSDTTFLGELLAGLQDLDSSIVIGKQTALFAAAGVVSLVVCLWVTFFLMVIKSRKAKGLLDQIQAKVKQEAELRAELDKTALNLKVSNKHLQLLLTENANLSKELNERYEVTGETDYYTDTGFDAEFNPSKPQFHIQPSHDTLSHRDEKSSQKLDKHTSPHRQTLASLEPGETAKTAITSDNKLQDTSNKLQSYQELVNNLNYQITVLRQMNLNLTELNAKYKQIASNNEELAQSANKTVDALYREIRTRDEQIVQLHNSCSESIRQNDRLLAALRATGVVNGGTNVQ